MTAAPIAATRIGKLPLWCPFSWVILSPPLSRADWNSTILPSNVGEHELAYVRTVMEPAPSITTFSGHPGQIPRQAATTRALSQAARSASTSSSTPSITMVGGVCPVPSGHAITASGRATADSCSYAAGGGEWAPAGGELPAQGARGRCDRYAIGGLNLPERSFRIGVTHSIGDPFGDAPEHPGESQVQGAGSGPAPSFPWSTARARV